MVIDTKRTTWSQSDLSTENRIVEDASVESEIEATQSESVILSVIHRLHLDEDPEFSAIGNGLIPSLFHHTVSPPARCNSLWWITQSGTTNSSLTFRERPLDCANVKWCA